MNYGDEGTLATTGVTGGAAIWLGGGSLMLIIGIALVTIAAIGIKYGFRRGAKPTDPS